MTRGTRRGNCCLPGEFGDQIDAMALDLDFIYTDCPAAAKTRANFPRQCFSGGVDVEFDNTRWCASARDGSPSLHNVFVGSGNTCPNSPIRELRDSIGPIRAIRLLRICSTSRPCRASMCPTNGKPVLDRTATGKASSVLGEVPRAGRRGLHIGDKYRSIPNVFI
jgi:hypothetical protein